MEEIMDRKNEKLEEMNSRDQFAYRSIHLLQYRVGGAENFQAEPYKADSELANSIKEMAESLEVAIPEVWIADLGPNYAHVSFIVKGMEFICLSEQVFQNFTPQEIKAIIFHELAHQQRGIWSKIATTLFNPLARKEEFRADKVVAELGFGKDMISVLEKLKPYHNENDKKGSHPSLEERIRKVKALIQKTIG